MHDETAEEKAIRREQGRREQAVLIERREREIKLAQLGERVLEILRDYRPELDREQSPLEFHTLNYDTLRSTIRAARSLGLLEEEEKP